MYAANPTRFTLITCGPTGTSVTRKFPSRSVNTVRLMSVRVTATFSSAAPAVSANTDPVSVLSLATVESSCRSTRAYRRSGMRISVCGREANGLALSDSVRNTTRVPAGTPHTRYAPADESSPWRHLTRIPDSAFALFSESGRLSSHSATTRIPAGIFSEDCVPTMPATKPVASDEPHAET